ncbi:DUF5977 domain-containing protein [Flavobacterium sp. N502536]|uniref:DUF5977 domain-containing protein n=1 Tax=Flavobacterium sp. N502536 TaxID=2986837 RepID=UPI002221C2F8|nr:DUF5977 domain-containing protein [Flavobacterium sp. N502536]
MESKANIPVAGLRIAKITSFDTASNSTDVKHYYYGKKESRFTSTGVEGIPINLINFTEQRAFCDKNTGLPNYWNVETRATFMNINANSIYPLYRSMGNNSTTYEYVTVSHGGTNFENGGEEFQYYISADIPPYLCLDSYLTSAPWTNLSWKNGLLHIKRIFNKNLDNLNIVENQYKLEDQYTRKIPGVATEIKYNALYHFTSPNYRNIEHLNINKYTTNSYWFYLESESNTQYDVQGSNPVTTITTYKYNNPSHLKLSSQTVTISKQEVTDTKATIETKYFYPSDSDMASEPFRNELMAKNMIGKVLDTQVFKQGVKLSEQKTVYDKSAATGNLLLPRSVYANKGGSSIDLSLDKKMTYDQYDDKGNILQYTLESGIPVSIIWGYNKTQPIAKIENVVYNLIPSATITNLQTLSNADIDNCLSDNCTEQKLREGLRTFRSSLPNAFISSYTYNPLIGVTSVTDPKGIPSYYEYDSFGRLKFVKDYELNVLQKYCYNYKGKQTDCSDNTSTSEYIYKSAARSGLFTKSNCPAGGTGQSFTYSQVAGAYTSTISQADADSKGLALFNTNGQINADANGYCTFKSIALSGSFAKNNCAAGGVGSSVPFNQVAGAETSNDSQAHADSKGLTLFNTNGQANANSKGECTYSSIALSGSFTKNNCPVGGVGSDEFFSQVAGAETSKDSQADADSKGLALFNSNGRANANTEGYCTFTNTEKSGSFTKNNCAPGGVGSTEVYTVPAGSHFSRESQVAADDLAQRDVNNNGLENANSKGYCTFWNVAITRSYTKNNCPSGSVGTSLDYTIPAREVTSRESQFDADDRAAKKCDVLGRINVNTSGACRFYNTAKSGIFTKNNCPAGQWGAPVTYTVAAGIHWSESSQAEADIKAQEDVAQNGQNYANARGECGFYNAQTSEDFTRDNCGIGFIGSTETYTVPAHIYFSTISQKDANLKAFNDLRQNGKNYANTHGTCTHDNR